METLLSKELVVLVALLGTMIATRLVQTLRGKGDKNHESATLRNAEKLSSIQESLSEFKSGTEAWMQKNDSTHLQVLLQALVAKADGNAEALDEIARQLGKLSSIVIELDNLHKDSDSKFSTVHVIELLQEMDKEFTKLLNMISNNIREDLTDVKLLVKSRGD